MIADGLQGDFTYMMTLVGHLPEAGPENPNVPRLHELLDRLSALPPDQQANVMDAFLVLLQVQVAVNEPS